MESSAVLSARGIIFFTEYMTKFQQIFIKDYGRQSNPLQFFNKLKLFSTELQQMWLHLELHCSFGKVCFTQSDCVTDQLWPLWQIGMFMCLSNNQHFTHFSTPQRTQSSSTFGCSPQGSTTANQLSPLNPLSPLLSHLRHLLLTLSIWAFSRPPFSFYGNPKKRSTAHESMYLE